MHFCIFIYIPEQLEAPTQWDLSVIKRFMLILGPLSSLFDFCVFYVFLSFLKADESLFQTGWFLGSLATQILVIFLIRTKKNPFKSLPHKYLLLSSLGALGIGMLLLWSPFAFLFQLQTLPNEFIIALVILASAYLFLAEIAKRAFYRKLENFRKQIN